MAQPPQASNGLPPLNPSSPPNQPMEPQAAMAQAQHVQAMAQAQLNMLQQQLATLSPALGQTVGQMPQNFSATFHIHGQPMQAPQGMPSNLRSGPPSVPNLQAIMAEQQRLRGQHAMHNMHNHPPMPTAGAEPGTHPTPPRPTDHLTPNVPSDLSPFQRPSSAPGQPRHRQAASDAPPGITFPSSGPRSIPFGLPPTPIFNHLPHPFTHTHAMPRNSSQPTVWLASSRNGPEALVLAPGHGFFTSQGVGAQPAPTPTPTTHSQEPPTSGQPQPAAPQPPAANAGQGQVAIRQPADPAALPQRPQDQVQDDNELWGLVIQRGWLFLRLYMFMFVLSEPGTWRRYTLLIAAVIICLLPRENPLNNAFAAARRHIDNLIGPPHPQPRDRERDRARRQQRVQRGDGPTAAGAAPDSVQQNQPRPGNAQSQQAGPRNAGRPTVRGAVNTTPEETARRLVRENQQRNPNIFRDVFYWVEQAVALFLASLVPGIGERHVAAREEARREEARERLEAQRAREEEAKKEREGQEQIEKAGADGEAGPSNKSQLSPAMASTSTVEQAASTTEVGTSSGVERASDQQDGEVRARFAE